MPYLGAVAVTVASLTAMTAARPAAAEGPIALHPANPHYLLFRGHPTVLITSTEHYGAVLNADFDPVPYLDELRARGFNLTRLFSGTYREVPGSFGIHHNTLAPTPKRYCCPWARSSTPGSRDGGAKFDLKRWDDGFFRRLKGFVGQAARRGIVVELVLFCPLYDQGLWNASPMNARNNVNGIGNVPRTEVLTLKHPSLVAVQEAVVRKIIGELKDFDNVYYEVCNEPYFGGVAADWQDRIIATIVDAESGFAAKHLIAQNIANGSVKIARANPSVSIFNFHYSRPLDSVAWNYHLNKVVADDETGFKGSRDAPYRMEGWDFIMAGGAIYDNLDYSFTTAHPDGTAAVSAPGGGGPRLRGQLKALKDFIDRFVFIKMVPNNSVIKAGVPAGGNARALVEAGQAYAIYIQGGRQARLVLDLPPGRYRAEWIDPKTGKAARVRSVAHAGGPITLASPPYSEDIALRLNRSGTAP